MKLTEVTVLVDTTTGLVQSVSGPFWGEYRPTPEALAVETVARALWKRRVWAGRPVPFSDVGDLWSGWRVTQ